ESQAAERVQRPADADTGGDTDHGHLGDADERVGKRLVVPGAEHGVPAPVQIHSADVARGREVVVDRLGAADADDPAGVQHAQAEVALFCLVDHRLAEAAKGGEDVASDFGGGAPGTHG